MELPSKKKLNGIIIVSIISFIVGLIIFIIYGELNNWDWGEILTSKYAYLVYLVLLLWGVFLLILKLLDWANNYDK